MFPHSRGGVVAAVMIGLGRAIGETIAVALVDRQRRSSITPHLFGPGDTLASIIANQFGEATGIHRAALIGLGVVLFVLTVVVGILARGVRRAGPTGESGAVRMTASIDAAAPRSIAHAAARARGRRKVANVVATALIVARVRRRADPARVHRRAT